VCVLKDELSGVVLSFAREGGRLRVPAQWSDADVIESTVALHEGGRLRFAREENELLHALATRSLRSSLVIYLGHAGGIDDDLRACSVTIEPAASDEQLYADSLAFAGTPTGQPRRYEVTSDSNGLEPGEMRVELLRAAPRVVGLDEPFTATLRRRCVEMVAYVRLFILTIRIQRRVGAKTLPSNENGPFFVLSLVRESPHQRQLADLTVIAMEKRQ
jgi:hypothetical protein